MTEETKKLIDMCAHRGIEFSFHDSNYGDIGEPGGPAKIIDMRWTEVTLQGQLRQYIEEYDRNDVPMFMKQVRDYCQKVDVAYESWEEFTPIEDL